MTCSDTYLGYWQIVATAPVMLGEAPVPDHRAPAHLAGLVGVDAHVALGAPAPRGATAATRK